MRNKKKIYIILLILGAIGIIAIEWLKPKKTNWFPSYALHHKIPYGSYVFFNELKKNSSKSIEQIPIPPFDWLQKNKSAKGAYIFYNGGIHFGDDELDLLLDWVTQGNSLFVSTVDFEKKLLDTLHLETAFINGISNLNPAYQMRLSNPLFQKSKNAVFDKNISVKYFSKLDSSMTKITGFIQNKEYTGFEKSASKDSLKWKPHFIKQKFGDGTIYLHSFPPLFTNYFALQAQNKEYIEGVLSYLNQADNIYWDTYYKNGKTTYSSPMHLFLNNPSLKWSYYILLLAFLFYIIFEGKRKQRPIPIVKPPENKTLAYTETISEIYYHKKEHKLMAEKKRSHFIDYLRQSHFMEIDTMDQKYTKGMAEKLQVSEKEIQEFLKLNHFIENQPHISKEILTSFSNKIDHLKSPSYE